MTTSEYVNMTHAKDFCKRNYDKAHTDTRVFLYREDGCFDFCQEWDYYHGYGQSIPEQDVYACVFYGTGGYDEPPAFDVEYYP